MSQILQSVTSGNLPPDVPLNFQTQNGTATPAANLLIVNGNDSTENNNNGIISKGGVVGTSTINEVDLVLTNRIKGTVSTSGAVTSAIATFTPTVIGTYSCEIRVAAYNETASLGAGYSIFGAVRFDGTDCHLCGTPDKIVNEEGAMSSANVTLTVSPASIVLSGVGYAAQEINWSAVGLYTFIGVV